MSWWDQYRPYSGLGLFDMLSGKHGSSEDAANKYLNQIPGTVTGRLDPYAQQGGMADKDLWGRYSQMLNNPNELYDKFASSYKPSEAYQFKNKEMSDNLRNAAASGGQTGTPYHQEEQGKLTQGLLSQDQDAYINKLMGIFGQGLSGEQGVSERGFNANKDITDYLANVLGQQGQLAFRGQEGKNASQDALRNAFFSMMSKGATGGTF